MFICDLDCARCPRAHSCLRVRQRVARIPAEMNSPLPHGRQGFGQTGIRRRRCLQCNTIYPWSLSVCPYCGASASFSRVRRH